MKFQKYVGDTNQGEMSDDRVVFSSHAARYKLQEILLCIEHFLYFPAFDICLNDFFIRQRQICTKKREDFGSVAMIADENKLDRDIGGLVFGTAHVHNDGTNNPVAFSGKRSFSLKDFNKDLERILGFLVLVAIVVHVLQHTDDMQAETAKTCYQRSGSEP